MTHNHLLGKSDYHALALGLVVNWIGSVFYLLLIYL